MTTLYGVWEKQGFEKVPVSRAVRLQECPLGEFPLYEDIISPSYSKICGKILFTIFTQTIMHLVLPHPTKKIYMHNQNLGGRGKQGTLWSMEKWWIMLPFKLNLSGRSLAWYHLFFLGFYQRKLKIYIYIFFLFFLFVWSSLGMNGIILFSVISSLLPVQVQWLSWNP